MTSPSQTSPEPDFSILHDDLSRALTAADPGGADLRHLSLAGNTYTILLSGAETNGRHCLIDMHVPAGGGPPAHRHDFEEMFKVVHGEIEFTFRGAPRTVRAPSTVNIPADAPQPVRKQIG
jgi:mannose-6-phosphate isomerase-like protein (cupin superfamily)